LNYTEVVAVDHDEFGSLRSILAKLQASPALFEIEIENGHVEIIGQLAILIVAEDHADEFVANIDLRRVVLLRTPADLDISELEFGPEEPGKLLYFIGLHNDVP
jgi:hypothetical protein